MMTKDEEKARMEEEKQKALEEKQAQMRREIMKIMMDQSLSEEEKAHRRQALMMGGGAGKKDEAGPSAAAAATTKKGKTGAKSEEESSEQEVSEEEGPTFLDDTLKCAMCMNLCERPVTAPCQHNFCLVCFNKWRAQAKYKCPTCRADFPKQFAQNPRINTALILAIRLAKNPPKEKPAAVERRVEEDRPDEAYVTDRAVRAGRANASSGRIMVTAPADHFGPIGPEFDPERNLGVQVGDWWKDRLDCRQWGAHLPHVAGIAGQSHTGAQSVVLSGGYEDDRDEGEWFLYTGSGGKDLSGNKRTNKEHAFDQTFEKMNKALQLSCTLGLPVRVVRSHKEKRSAYAPTIDTPVRYDGVYRILRCWRKQGQNEDKHLICRYLFVRADNSPAPWSSSEGGDQGEQTIPKEAQDEIDEAVGQVYKMSDDPYWAFLPEKGEWGWKKPPPASKKVPGAARSSGDPTKKLKKHLTEQEKVLKEFRCALCKKTLQDPLSTPCSHLFCKGCLEAKFAGMGDVQQASGARSLRVRHIAKPCPCCKADLSSFLAVAQVNREMAAVIEKLQGQVADARRAVEKAMEEQQAAQDKSSNEDEDGEEEAEAEAEEEVEEEDAPGPSSRPTKSQKQQRGSTPGKAGRKGSTPGGKATAAAACDAAAATAAPEAPEAAAAGTSNGSQAKDSSARVGEQPGTANGGGHSEGEPTANANGSGAATQGASTANGEGGGPAAAAAAAAPAPADACAAANGHEANGVAGGGQAGTSGGGPAAPQPPPVFKYAKQLAMLQEQFPDMDSELVKCILEDEEGDVPNARSKLRELRKGMLKVQAKSPKKTGNSKRPYGAGTSNEASAAANGAEKTEGEQPAKKPKQSRR